jgi:hypothetical protein
MTFILVLLAGAALGGAFVWLALSRRGHGVRALAVGLAVAAAVYVGFAVAGGAPARWLLLEVGGLAIFGALALVGYRRAPPLVAAGWLLHVLWDAPLHVTGGAATYTPQWYPALCLGFDPVAAIGAAMLAARS